MKNKLIDLNNHLFAQLERIGEEGISPEKLKSEINRSIAMAKVSSQIVKNAALALKAEEFKRSPDFGQKLPEMIEQKND